MIFIGASRALQKKYLLLQANELNKVRYFEIIKCGDFVFDVSQRVFSRIFN